MLRAIIPPPHRPPRCATVALLGLLSLFAERGLCQPRINEIMYAPVSPEPEWIEIFNPDSISYALKNWEISTVTKSATVPAFIIVPGEYLVITKDTGALRLKRPGIYPVVQLPLPALKNTGGFVILRDSTHLTIDSFEYQPSWGGAGGGSLERRTILGLSTLASTWGNSKDTSGATPGRRNSIAIPLYDLTLDSLAYHFTNDTLELSVRVVNDGLRTVRQAQISVANDTGAGMRIIATISIDSLPPDSSHITSWTIPNQSIRGTPYTVFISCSQDTSHANDTLHFASLTGSQPLSIVINEIMFAPVKPEPEWIELLNASKDTIDISGWHITVAHGTPQTIPEIAPLPPDSMVVLTTSDSLLAALRHVNRERVIHFPLQTLSNAGSTLSLHDLRNDLIDTVNYLGTWIKADGTSIERIDPTQPGIDPLNWKACEDTSGATILAPNSVRLRAYDLALTGYSITDSSLVLTLVNVGRDTVSNTAIELHGYNSLLQPITSPLANCDSLHITIPIQSTFYGTDSLTANIRDSLDLNHTNDTLRMSLTVDIPPDSLVINEIFFQPATGACEWIELYNASSRTVLMGGLRLLAGSKSLSTFGLPSFQIPGTSLGVIAANNTFLTSYPALTLRPELAILGRSSLDLSNDSASVVLRNPDDSMIDSVRYHASWQTSLRPSLIGVSLERKHWDGPSNDSTNWQSSNDSSGGTPLMPNSATHSTASTPAGGTLSESFSPNPFSPDGDGFEDESVLTIQSGDDAQYALRVRLYDARGRVVRTLADAITMTSSISIAVDGKNNAGQMLPPGLYTTLIELSTENPPRLLRKIIGIGVAGKRR